MVFIIVRRNLRQSNVEDFKLGDRVLYEDTGGKGVKATILGIRFIDREPSDYIVITDDNRCLVCSKNELSKILY